MGYNKSDESSKYNKEERGGWYCTNPKKHDEGHQHHATDAPHSHPAERNEQQPDRHENEPSRYERESRRPNRKTQQKPDDGQWNPMSTTPPRKRPNPIEPIPETHETPDTPETPAEPQKKKNIGCYVALVIFIILLRMCS